MEIRNLVCKTLRDKPETRRASRRLGNIDFSKLIHMGLNENVFGMSPKAVEIMNATTESGNYYQDWTQKELKAAIAEHYGVTPDYIVTGCGSSSLTEALGTAFLEPGDEIVLCMPTFPAIIDTAQMNGASAVIVQMGEDLIYDMDALLAAITDKTKLVYICNPNNPTGTYVSKDKLMEFASKCPDHVIQVYDEAYIEFAEAPDCLGMTETMKTMPEKPIVLLKTFSKFYGMAGIRAGYILAQPEIIEWLSKCGTQFALSKVSQAGAAAAMKDLEHQKYVKEENTKWRGYLMDGLAELGCKVYPSQTNFIFFHPHVDPETVSMKMMERGIMISAQAGANRVSVGKPEHCELFLKYMKEIIEEMKAEG